MSYNTFNIQRRNGRIHATLSAAMQADRMYQSGKAAAFSIGGACGKVAAACRVLQGRLALALQPALITPAGTQSDAATATICQRRFYPPTAIYG